MKLVGEKIHVKSGAKHVVVDVNNIFASSILSRTASAIVVKFVEVVNVVDLVEEEYFIINKRTF